MKKVSKTIIRGILILSYLLITSIILFLIGTLFSYLNTGADRSKMLNLGVEKVDLYLPKLTWTADGNEGRNNEPTYLKRP